MKPLTEESYKKYMTVVTDVIKETERRMKALDRYKEIANMSFEEWKEFQINQRNGYSNGN